MEPERVRDHIVAVSRAMRSVAADARRLAATNDPVLIDGEAGTGRKLLARMIHDEGPRSSRPFAIVRSDRLTVDMLDRVLLGDASSKQIGKLEEVRGGTLVISELEDLNPVAQERLLSLIEEGSYTDLNGQKKAVECRILCTGRGDEIQKRLRLGKFSNDLYRRLSMNSLCMPSLCDRRDDIPHLVVEVLHDLAARERIEVPVVPYHYMELLMNVSWPENVRQLRNHVESVMVLSSGNFDPEIIREHFEPDTSTATIKGALQSLWNRLRGSSAELAIDRK
jgi:DNA-binding NtrC family response regulator